MQTTLMAKDVSIHSSTCRDQMIKAMANGYVGPKPQRNGGQALPSAIEKEIALTARTNFPVFPDDVINWAAE